MKSTKVRIVEGSLFVDPSRAQGKLNSPIFGTWNTVVSCLWLVRQVSKYQTADFGIRSSILFVRDSCRLADDAKLEIILWMIEAPVGTGGSYRNALRTVAVVASAMLAVSEFGGPARAGTLSWDTDGATGGNNASTGANLGGSGVWSTADANWWEIGRASCRERV